MSGVLVQDSMLDAWFCGICGCFRSIVFRKRYQVGLRLSARATEGKNKLLGLMVRYMNSSCSFEAPSGEQRWLQHSVRIKLGDVSAN